MRKNYKKKIKCPSLYLFYNLAIRTDFAPPTLLSVRKSDSRARWTRRSRNDIEICLASTQDQSILWIFWGRASQFDLQLTRRESLSVIQGGTCRFCPDSSKCAASKAARPENRLNSRYEKKSTVKDCNARGSWLIYNNKYNASSFNDPLPWDINMYVSKIHHWLN